MSVANLLLNSNSPPNLTTNLVFDVASGAMRVAKSTDFNGGSASSLNTSGVFSTNGVCLPANPNRSFLYVQNVSTSPLYLMLSASAPSTGSFNVLLYGLGSSGNTIFQDSLGKFKGAINASGVPPTNFTAFDF